jgi:hypothetical protein
MKKEDADKLKDPPWDHKGVVYCPGRYYYGLASAALPPGVYPHGGDVMLCLWRYDHTPDEWITTFRIRINAGPNSDPWTGGDKKKWIVGKSPKQCDEATAVLKAREVMTVMISGAQMISGHPAPCPIDWLIIEGDFNKAYAETLRQKKPWMLMKTEKIE